MKMGVFVSDYALPNDTLDRVKADGLGLILVANGVYHAALKQGGKPSALLDKTKDLYVLGEDLKTRGIAESAVDKRVKVVGYADVVDLIFNQYEKLAWL